MANPLKKLFEVFRATPKTPEDIAAEAEAKQLHDQLETVRLEPALRLCGRELPVRPRLAVANLAPKSGRSRYNPAALGQCVSVLGFKRHTVQPLS